jgi:Cu/Ag efflux pump CusA
MVGAGAILTDPIFNGMAVSILFGMMTATVFTMIVIPLGCISAEKRFHRHTMERVEAPMGSETEESVKST